MDCDRVALIVDTVHSHDACFTVLLIKTRLQVLWWTICISIDIDTHELDVIIFRTDCLYLRSLKLSIYSGLSFLKETLTLHVFLVFSGDEKSPLILLGNDSLFRAFGDQSHQALLEIFGIVLVLNLLDDSLSRCFL